MVSRRLVILTLRLTYLCVCECFRLFPSHLGYVFPSRLSCTFVYFRHFPGVTPASLDMSGKNKGLGFRTLQVESFTVCMFLFNSHSAGAGRAASTWTSKEGVRVPTP